MGDRLADAGFDVMRFDYYASGDSAGDDGEFDVDGAIADTVAAGQRIMERSRAIRLSYLGLRLGATIAALASNLYSDELEHLILFEPIVDGDHYLQELNRANAEALRATFGPRWRIDPALREFNLPDPSGEALGFTLTAAFKAQLTARVSLEKPWPGRARNIAIVTCDAPTVAILGALRGNAATRRSIQVVCSDSEIDWATNSALNTAIVPRSWVEHTLSALTSSTAPHA